VEANDALMASNSGATAFSNLARTSICTSRASRKSTVIGGRPQVSLIAGFDQLASDANARAIASDASLQHASDA